MTELSNLLKEAKPLYYEQKRIKQRIKKTCFSLSLLFMVLASGYGGYALKSVTAGNYIANSDTSSNVIESYYPTDDYGLITVAY